MTWLAGLTLIVSGIVCLCLSGAVVGPGWWQGILGAFGVGFIVGGIVDVLAVSLMNQVISGVDQREQRYLGWRVEELLEFGQAAQIQTFLRNHGDELDPLLRNKLERKLVELRRQPPKPSGPSIKNSPWRPGAPK